MSDGPRAREQDSLRLPSATMPTRRPSTTLAACWALAAACAVACGPQAAETGEAPGPDAQGGSPARPNLVLISLDNLGARHLGCYGYERETSPFLDSLAEQGVLFEQAISADTWTLPSHVSLLSSRPVGAHGVWQIESRLPVEARLVQEVLQDGGYHTAAFTSCLFVSELYGFGRGFDHLRTEHTSADKLKPLIETHLDGLGDEPFFLFLHYYDVHQPFDEPNPYGQDFTEGIAADAVDAAERMAALAGRPAESLTAEEISWLVEAFPEHDVRERIAASAARGDILGDWVLRFVYRYLVQQGPEAMRSMQASYDNGVANMDKHLADLFQSLRERPWFEDTIFVITSDHGEAFNEHPGHIGHGGPPYQDQAHVPLIVLGRDIPGGRRVGATVGGVDVAPTLLDLAGLPTPDEFQGRSLSPAFSGSIPERPTLSGARVTGRVAAVDGAWKLMHRGEDARTVELLSIPEGESRDHATSQPDRMRRLTDWLGRSEQRNADAVSSLSSTEMELDEETTARLRELGYIR